MNNAAMNTHIQVLCGHIFLVLLVISRNGIAGSYGNSLFNTMRFVLQTSAHLERPVKCFK